jgi:hypothetical protein
MPALAPLSRGPLFESVSTETIERWTLVDARWTPNQPGGVTPENESDV